MNTTEFYGWQVAWYVFGTLASFAAALLFYRKGAASAGGKGVAGNLATWKLTGAAAIFIVVLGAFHFMNPLSPLSDRNRVLVIYTTQGAGQPPAGSAVPFTIQTDVFRETRIDPKSIVIEMLPADAVESLLPGIDEKSFSTQRPIAPGTYRVRLIEKDTGKFRDFTMEVPPHAR
jgi:hypothetical protein